LSPDPEAGVSGSVALALMFSVPLSAATLAAGVVARRAISRGLYLTGVR
jgi:hypothetical protein